MKIKIPTCEEKITKIKLQMNEQDGRKVGPSPGTSGPPVPPVPQDPMDPRDPQDLWTLGPLRTSEPQEPCKIISNA